MLDTLEKNKELLQFNAGGVEPGRIWIEASEAGKKAVHDYLAEHEEPMYCGFANVKIRPAKGSFVKWLKERKIGDKGWNGGYSISYYDFMGDVRESFTQSMDLKEMGCDAFVAVLRKYGMDAYMESRAD
tara:strand:- start:7345 stop:7731 length:387 start_codon:yes stop_codon:yes gene_type:complete